MNILVLGGTGAMGIPLVNKLALENKVYVTTRGFKESTSNIKYLQGNATQPDFIDKVLGMMQWDVIVDFMVHSETNLKVFLPKFLDNTRQYIFISSARVYAQTEELITEDSPRLLEASTDVEYLKTNEYALAKAREEDLLLKSGCKNFTIIRPSITYNSNRLQLGVLEKESWLYRALQGRSIVFSNDINDKLTTMTHGYDVSMGISSLIGRDEALGQVFHITYPTSLLWSEVLSIYLSVLEKHLGHKVNVVMTEKSTNLKFKNRVYQVIYCRYFNRTFDNKKIAKFYDISTFTSPQNGLIASLEEFLKKPHFLNISWELEAVNDRVAGERTPLKEIPTIWDKVTYFCYRNNMVFMLGKIRHVLSILAQIKNKIRK